jgi:hypothetical protein
MDKNCRIVTNHNVKQIQKAKQLGCSDFTIYCYKNPDRRKSVCGVFIEVENLCNANDENFLISMKNMLFDHFKDSGKVFDYIKIYYTYKKEE